MTGPRGPQPLIDPPYSVEWSEPDGKWLVRDPDGQPLSFVTTTGGVAVPEQAAAARLLEAVAAITAAREVTATARAFYRGYPGTSERRSRRVTRLHILNDWPPPVTPVRERRVSTMRQGLCGTSAAPHTSSEPVIIDPMPAVPPAGLLWCPSCIGHLAAQTKQLAAVAMLLAGSAAA